MNIEFKDIDIKSSLVSFFHVKGEYRGEEIDEVVAVSRKILSGFFRKILSEEEYLSKVLMLKDDCNKGRYRRLFSRLAYEQHKKKKDKYEKFKTLLYLSKDKSSLIKRRGQTNIFKTYNKKGEIVASKAARMAYV